MKWKNKYDVDLNEIHMKNKTGYSLTELSVEYNIPKSTLNRYLHNAGYDVLMNRKEVSYSYYVTKRNNSVDIDFGVNNTGPWKRSLVFYYGHICYVCGYDKIVEAHHIIPISDGGTTSVRNGILLCPNCHAEVHAELLNLTEALIKLGELLETSLENNQQPSCVSKYIKNPRDTEGSTTNSRAKAVMETRAPKSNGKRNGKEQFFIKFPSFG